MRLGAQQSPCADRSVAEIGEHAIDAEHIKLEIFLYRVKPVVGSEEIGLVAEGVGMDQKASPMGVGHQISRRQQRPVGTPEVRCCAWMARCLWRRLRARRVPSGS